MATEFDDAQLEAITGGDTDFEREVLEEYLQSAPGDLQRLRTAIAANDAKATGAAAHAIKGASATIGAKGFAAIALQLEQIGKQERMAEAAATLARLEAEYAELAVRLKGRIERAA